MADETIIALPEFTLENVKAWRAFLATLPDKIAGVDVETTAITDTSMFDPDAKMRLIQFGSLDTAWVLDPHSEWRPLIIEALSSALRFVSHSAYDVLWCRREFGVRLGRRGINTLILANLLVPGPTNPHDLKSLSVRHLDDKLVEAEKRLHARFKELAPVGHRVGTKPGSKLMVWGFNNIPLDDPAYTEYGGLDAIYVRRVLDILGESVHPGMRKLSRREQRIDQLAIDMQWRGHKVDRDYTKKLLDEIDTEWQAADQRLHQVFGFSPRSPRRAEWFEERGIEFAEQTKTGRPSITGGEDGTIAIALRRYNDPLSEEFPVLQDLYTLSINNNVRNNLIILLDNADADGKVHPSINTCQAVTGRMSITKPALQTFKKNDPRLRGCAVADDGWVLVTADYDSQEVRLAYAYSRDKAYGRVINDKLNMHDLTASSIFGDNFSAEQRDVAKVLNFCVQYGGGPKAISAQSGLSHNRARALWQAWRHTYAGLVKWTEKMAELQVVVNPWGRRIPADRWRKYASGNLMIQSSGRDLLGDAMVRLDDAGWGEYLWLPIHDELVLHVPAEFAEAAKEALQIAMYDVVRGVEMTASAKILGTRWNGS